MPLAARSMEIDTRSRINIPLRYLLAALGSAFGTLAVYVGLLIGLNAKGHLPPPPITNNVCLDEKLQFLRDNPDIRPDVLVVGSSVAWRDFIGEQARLHAPSTWPLNGGLCGLHADQIDFAARFFLPHYQTIRKVGGIIAPQDFDTCAASARLFDSADVDAFVSGKSWIYTYYLRYFDPVSLVRNALTIARQRSDPDTYDTIENDAFGDSPSNTDLFQDQNYGAFSGFDSRCFEALRDLAYFVGRSGRPLTVVISPLEPSWHTRFDPTGTTAGEFRRSINKAIFGTRAALWDADKEMELTKADFIDAIHLRLGAARRFSAALSEAAEFRLPTEASGDLIQFPGKVR